MIIKWFLKRYCYARRSAPCSAFRKACFLLIETNSGTYNWIMCREWGALGHSVLKGTSSSKPCTLCLGYLGRKTVRSRGNCCLQWNSVFQIQLEWCTCKLKETLAACTEPPQVHTKQSPSTERGKWTWASTLSKKLSMIDIHWKKKKTTFLQWSLTEYTSHTPVHAHTQEELAKAKQTMVFL